MVRMGTFKGSCRSDSFGQESRDKLSNHQSSSSPEADSKSWQDPNFNRVHDSIPHTNPKSRMMMHRMANCLDRYRRYKQAVHRYKKNLTASRRKVSIQRRRGNLDPSQESSRQASESPQTSLSLYPTTDSSPRRPSISSIGSTPTKETIPALVLPNEAAVDGTVFFPHLHCGLRGGGSGPSKGSPGRNRLQKRQRTKSPGPPSHVVSEQPQS
jgi:hypothetical protein